MALMCVASIYQPWSQIGAVIGETHYFVPSADVASIYGKYCTKPVVMIFSHLLFVIGVT